MNRSELVVAVAAQTDQDPKVVDAVLRGAVEVISATVRKEPVVISGFARFAVRRAPARTARNPQTGEPVRVKASTKVRITPGKTLKEIASGSSPAPKLTRPAAKASASRTTAARKTAPAKRTAAKKASASRTTAARKTPPAKRTAASRPAAPAKRTAAKKASASRTTAKRAAPSRRR
jgi:DNA-binding protein HU-beta